MLKIKHIENGKIAVETPYNKEFIKRVKQLGGRWDSDNRVWTVDERNLELVREIMRDVYGHDDLPQDTVTVKLTITENIEAKCGPIMMFGKTIASAWGRDTGARPGPGVTFKAGECGSGGSRANWLTKIYKGSEIIVYDVPRRAVESKVGWEDSYGTFEVIETDPTIEALEEERRKLLERLAEIDEILKARRGQ